MGPPIKRLVARIGDEVSRAVGWQRFVRLLAALAGVSERSCRAKDEFSNCDSAERRLFERVRNDE